MFKVFLEILESGRFKEESTQQLILTALLTMVGGVEDRKTILKWFYHADGTVIGSKGQDICKLTLR